MLRKICLFFTLMLLSSMTFAASITSIQGVKLVASQYSVAETTANLAKLIRKDRRFVIKGIIDHQKIAAMQGHKVGPNMEIEFGCPSYDYLMVKSNPQAPLFLPLRLVIWQSDAGRTYISYWDPSRDIIRILDLKQVEAIRKAKWVSTRIAQFAQLSANR